MRKKHILETFKKMGPRKWDTLFWAVDIHDTIIKANYSKTGVLPTEFFPKAKEVLQRISKRTDCRLILFTCSHPGEIEKYMKFFTDNGITFSHVNKNPEAENTAYGFFEHKFYFNFLLDDKAGFDPMEDWDIIDSALDEIDELPIIGKTFTTDREMTSWLAVEANIDGLKAKYPAGEYSAELNLIDKQVIITKNKPK